MKFLILNAEHAELSTVLGNSLTILISFILLLAILSKVAIGPVMKMIEKREEEINGQLEHASLTEKQAVEHEQEAKTSAQKAHLQAQDIVSKAHLTSVRLKDDMMDQAKQDIVHLRAAAQDAIELERQTMKTELTAQVADISVELTKRLLKRELTQDDHQRLIAEFIEGLEQ